MTDSYTGDIYGVGTEEIQLDELSAEEVNTVLDFIKSVTDVATSETTIVNIIDEEAGAYYANPVEYGHGGPAPAPAHPFVRPAFDARAEEAYGEIKRVLADELKNRT